VGDQVSWLSKHCAMQHGVRKDPDYIGLGARHVQSFEYHGDMPHGQKAVL
jgi:hypothetical protein